MVISIVKYLQLIGVVFSMVIASWAVIEIVIDSNIIHRIKN